MAEPRRCALLCGAQSFPPPPPTTWEPLSFRRCPFAVPPRRDGAELGVRGLRTGTAPPALPRLAVPLSPHPRARVLHHRSCVYLRLHRVCSWGLGPWRNVTLCRRVSPGRHPPVRAPPRSSAAPGSGRGVTEPGRVSSSPGVAAAAPSGHAAPIPAGSARPSARGGHGRALRGSAKRGGYGRPEGTGRGGPRGPRSRTARRGALLGPRLEARWSGRINIARGSSPARRKSKRASRAGGYFQSKRRGGASCAQAAVRLRFRGGGAAGGVLFSQLPLPRAEPLPGLSAAERDGANSAQMPRSAAHTTLLSAEPCVRPACRIPYREELAGRWRGSEGRPGK